MKRTRGIALLLCVVMVLGMIPVMSASAAEEELTVSQTSADLPKNKSVDVTAACSNENAAPTYQWQIRVPGTDLWVDISGENSATIRVTYAMVANLLSGSQATLRAKAAVSGATIYSDEVAVSVTEPEVQTAAADSSTFSLRKSSAKSIVPKIVEAISAAPVADLSALQAKVEEAKTALTGAEEEYQAATDAVNNAQMALDDANAASAAEVQPETVAVEEEQSEEVQGEEVQGEEGQSEEAQAEEPQSEPQQPVASGPSIEELQSALDAAKAVQSEAGEKLNKAKSAYDAAVAEYDAANKSTASYVQPHNTDSQTTYNVVINYVFENNEVAADPYTASLAAGSNFSATVIFPTVQGYLPYLDNNQQNSIDLNYTSINQDYTYNVVYKPTNVNYTVIHYRQNLNDDNYTEVARETKQGLTNDPVPEVAKTYEGFYALLYEKPNIADDGSTVVEVYYDRYYYLMNFDLDGGYGVEPIYARYGADISVGTPEKAGYSFGGWSLDGTNIVNLPETMPVANKTYKAIWTANDTAKVTVVFWGENADDEGYSYIRSMQVDETPGKNYSYDGSSLTCPLAEHSHNECKLNCTHTHTLDCYYTDNEFTKTEKPSETLTDNGNGIYTFTTGWWQTTHYYLNIGDQWYCGTNWRGNEDDTQSITFSCPHTHTDECYDCGQIVHTHGSACSGLWKFVRSETVTVAADGSSVVNVYYDRVEYSVQFFRRDYPYSEYTNLKITAKWGANILDKWPTVNGSSSWYVNTTENKWQNSIQVMPVGGAKFYGPKTGSSSSTAYYYVEVLPGETGTEHNGVLYKIHHKDVSSSTGNVTTEDKYEIQGFTYKEGTDNGNSYNNAKFYYARNSYKLTFHDGYNAVKTESVKYEAPLSTYSSYVPEVPSAYEPGSVTFGGWYLNPECTGAEYKLSEHKMPADNVLLYAKWVPVTHTVEFYLDLAALDAGTKLNTHPDITVPHGSKADPTPKNPTNGSYTFVGWFYMENGVEKAFDFANMPVNKDLKVYGKWSSNVLKEYTIYYKIQGTDTKIAAPTTGSGLAGITKTFEAKGGTDLYADYQEGYFPVTKSHSMTLDINATEENDTNVFTFWYVQKEAVPYTVKYLNKETGEPVATEKTVSDNRKAVVTETFVPVSGMMPDAYQKRLVVSAEDGAVNEIIFYYTEDTTHAYYKITHYTENLGMDAQGNPTWTEYASSQAVGDIGTTYTADPMTIPGFTYDSTVSGTVVSGELTANGLELKLYYTRNSYPYQVRYLEEGTGKQLADPKNGTGKYGQVVSESAIDITNYEAVAHASQTLNIRIEEGTEAKLNIITFYYQEQEVTINYVVVGPDGCGTVSPANETLKVLSGTAQGSTPTASSNLYRFVGWFEDRECTKSVNSNWVDASNKLMPQKTDGTHWTAATYYAKFEYDLTELTINKILDTTSSKDESFVFTVNGAGITTTVVIQVPAGEISNSITISGLKVGETVTVTEDASFNRDYNSRSGTANVTLSAGASKNTVTISNSKSSAPWLSESGHIANWFNKK